MGRKATQSKTPAIEIPPPIDAFSADYIASLQAHFAEHGADTLRRLCDEKPQDYMRLIAATLPKDAVAKIMAIEHSRLQLEAMDDAQHHAAVVAALRDLARNGVDLRALVDAALGELSRDKLAVALPALR